MVREKMKQQQSRFFLRRRSRFAGKEYYHESGTQCIGTPDEKDYINWTRYRDEAHGFGTIKQARKMAATIWERFGQKVDVVDRDGEVC
ncbi:MAG: hypothetical protein IKF99_11825 [Oscillospiraceae bacterium]|jgi:hypothetical protein|nr:hypothetical protein [Oscillospiraceae bacterium]